jgi:hypothetical protein
MASLSVSTVCAATEEERSKKRKPTILFMNIKK